MAATQAKDIVVKSLMIHIEEEKLAKIWEVWLFGNVQGCLLFSRLERNFWHLLETPSYSKRSEGIWKGGCLETSSIDPLGCYVQNFRKGQPNQWNFFQLLVLQKTTVIWTGYMQSIMEPRSMIQYFFIQNFQGLFCALLFPRPNFFRALFFYLAFSKTKDKMF